MQEAVEVPAIEPLAAAVAVADEAYRDRPVIGICNTWSELVNCNGHLRGLAQAVKRGVLQAGGFRSSFPSSRWASR